VTLQTFRERLSLTCTCSAAPATTPLRMLPLRISVRAGLLRGSYLAFHAAAAPIHDDLRARIEGQRPRNVVIIRAKTWDVKCSSGLDAAVDIMCAAASGVDARYGAAFIEYDEDRLAFQRKRVACAWLVAWLAK